MEQLVFLLETEPNPEMMETERLFPDSSWFSADAHEGFCPECLCVKRDLYPIPLNIVLSDVPDGRVSVPVERMNFYVWRADFLEFVGDYLNDFAVGKCYLSDGSLLADYVTCYHRCYTTIRGNQHSRYKICGLCGTAVTEYLSGPEHVAADNIPSGPIFQDEKCRFLVKQSVLEKLDFRKYDKGDSDAVPKAILVYY